MTLTLLKFFALLALFVSILLLVQQSLNASLTRRMEQRAINERLRMLKAGTAPELVTNILRGRPVPFGSGTFLGSFIANYYRVVARANIRTHPARLALTSLLATAILMFALVLLAKSFATPMTSGVILLLTLFSVALGIGVPWMFISRRAMNRSKMMEEQFPAAIDIFTRALRSGHPIASAITLLTQEMPDPIGSEFGLVADEVAYGSELNDSLRSMSDRWDLEDLRMFAVCLSVQSETGGNLAEILMNLSQVIRDRASMYLKVRALSSEGRVSAWMLSVLPVLTFVLLFSINPEFFLDVAQDPIFTKGLIILLFLYTVGVLWIRRMVDLKV